MSETKEKQLVKFTDILAQVSKSQRALNDHKKRTFDWFRDNAKQIRSVARKIDKDQIDPKTLMTSGDNTIKSGNLVQSMIGKMIMYYYDPKLKKTLPYYDALPLVFPIELYSDCFLAINLHYLPPNARAILFGNLMYQLFDKDQKDHLKISYKILKAASRLKIFKPCVKKYLYSHLRSRFVIIDPKQWDAALMLPSQQFQKASEQKVWQDSIDKIKG